MKFQRPGAGLFRLVASLGASALLAACQRDAKTAGPGGSGTKPAAPPRAVKAVRAESRTLERVVHVTGSLAAYDQATLSTKVPGRLQTIAVDLGAIVRAGQVIAQIEPDDYQLKVRQAEALLTQARVRLGLPREGSEDKLDPENTSAVRQTQAVLGEARANRDRLRNLSAQKIISNSELESADAEFEVAQSKHEAALEEVRNLQALVAQRRVEVEIARQQLADTTLRAPFDGAVAERRANLGENLAGGAPIVTLVRTNPLRLRLEVPEREAPLIAAGQTVRVAIEGMTNRFPGTITRLSPAIDEHSLILRIEADVPNPGHLRPGSYAKAEIVVLIADPAVTVPATAITTFAGLEKVFLAASGKAMERGVTTGRRGPGYVEILSGVRAGDVVILSPGSLLNGQAISVTFEAPAPANSKAPASPDDGGEG